MLSGNLHFFTEISISVYMVFKDCRLLHIVRAVCRNFQAVSNRLPGQTWNLCLFHASPLKMMTLTWFQKGQAKNELNKYLCLVHHPHIVFHWFMKLVVQAHHHYCISQKRTRNYLFIAVFNWGCFNNLSVANHALFLSTIPCLHAIEELGFIRICKRSALPFMWLNVDLFYKLPHCHNLHGFPSDFLESDSFL